MTLSIELKHGRLAIDDATAKKLSKFLFYAGDLEIRLAGRYIIFDDAPPLKLVTPKPPKRPRKARRKK